MGHLRRRGDAWELRVSAYGRTHTRTFRGSETAARKALRVYELDLKGGGHDTDRTTIAELVDIGVNPQLPGYFTLTLRVQVPSETLAMLTTGVRRTYLNGVLHPGNQGSYPSLRNSLFSSMVKANGLK